MAKNVALGTVDGWQAGESEVAYCTLTTDCAQARSHDDGDGQSQVSVALAGRPLSPPPALPRIGVDNPCRDYSLRVSHCRATPLHAIPSPSASLHSVLDTMDGYCWLVPQMSSEKPSKADNTLVAQKVMMYPYPLC